MSDPLFEIRKYNFGNKLPSEISDIHYVSGLWPLVYIISDENSRELYIGETTDAVSRMQAHLKNNEKSRLTAVHLITSSKFNKSATLDIESNLIKYLSGDGKYKLLNANVGLANHTYFQKTEVYWDIFKTLWTELKSEGITHNSLDHINNSDLFKYSPYKSLSSDQKMSILEILRGIAAKNIASIVVEGGAGTGKTILAIYLFKLLNSDIEDFNFKEFGEDEEELIFLVKKIKEDFPKLSMALVVPMSSFRNTLKAVFKNIKGLTSNMVVGPAEVSKKVFDIILVDESHRLRKRVNLGAYFGAFDKVNQKLKFDKFKGNEFKWIIKQSKKRLFFYDYGQSIKPSDVDKEDFDDLKSKNNTIVQKLKSQFRVKGGVDYVTYLDNLLNCKFKNSDSIFNSKKYDFALFDSLDKMIEVIKEKEKESGLSRMIAGYSWEWISKNDSSLHDIKIGDVKLRWNSVSDDFINSANAINEVGCIHTTQGYDLNYSGVIFGNEISYDKQKDEIIIKEENYFDRNGKQNVKSPEQLKEYILNIYKTILLRGMKGTYVYVCDDKLREYFAKHIPKYQVQSIAKEITETLIESPYMGTYISAPLFESVGCGELMVADSTVQETISVMSDKLPKGHKYFILKASGDSMNLAGIKDGNLVLCRKDYHPENGDRVVALIGNDATIKNFKKHDGIVTLSPVSSNPSHEPLVFKEGDDIQIQGVVVKVLHEDDLVS